MGYYWAVLHGADGDDSPAFLGPFETESQAREGRDSLLEAHYHLDAGAGWACYVMRRPRDWEP